MAVDALEPNHLSLNLRPGIQKKKSRPVMGTDYFDLHKRQGMKRIKQERLSRDEMSRISQTFYTPYPPSPSTVQAAGRFELQHRKETSASMEMAVCET